MSVVINVPNDKYGTHMEYYKHHDTVSRRTLEAGTSEVSWRALYYLCHVYKEELEGTEFQQFPCRKKEVCYWT